jgi:serine/threonine protein kinase
MSADVDSTPSTPATTAVLAVGTRIDRYTVLHVLHEGPNGNVYLTRDDERGVTRVLKEFMPRVHAMRLPDGAIVPRDAGDSIAVSVARMAFRQEANTLAGFDHPGLVHVQGLLRAHRTLYRVMPLYDGLTLERHCKGRHAAPTVRWLAALVDDLAAALEALHARGLAHGCVQPDQVLVSDSRRAMLFGFGSVARELEGSQASPWRAPQSPSFRPHRPPRPAGDIYALAATAWFAATGESPPTALQRSGMRWRAGARLATLGDGAGDSSQLRRGLIQAIESGLATASAARPQSIADFRRLLQCEASTRDLQADRVPLEIGQLPVAGVSNDPPPRGMDAPASATMAVRPVRAAVAMPLLQARPPRIEVAVLNPARDSVAHDDVLPFDLPASGPAADAPAPPSTEPSTDVAEITHVTTELVQPAPVPTAAARTSASNARALGALALAGAALALWMLPAPVIDMARAPPSSDPAASTDVSAPEMPASATGVPFETSAVALPSTTTAPAPVAAAPVLAQTQGPALPTAAAARPPAAMQPRVAAASKRATTAGMKARAATAQAAASTVPAKARAQATPRKAPKPSRASVSGAVVSSRAQRSPAAECASRMQSSFTSCMQEQCAQPSQRSHRHCIEFRRKA